MTTHEQAPAGWWNRTWIMLALIIAAAVPLLWPDIAPLTDLPGHMARYRVELDGPASPLRQFYTFHWAMIGNLGIDLLILPLSPLFGLEPAVKLIIIAIPVLTVVGMLLIARSVHGRVPPTALFALPLAYGHPFLFGFVNFSLGMALALLAFALWLRLGRPGQIRLRGGLFLLIAPMIWLTHAFAWGVLGVIAFAAEALRQRRLAHSWLRSVGVAMLHCLVLAPPLLAMILWRHHTDAGQQTGDWFNWAAKTQWLLMTLRDRWHAFDVICVGVLVMLIFVGTRDARFRLDSTLAACAALLLAIFVLLPRIIFGSAYADMRLTPFIFAFAIIAIRPAPELGARIIGRIAALAAAFFVVRMTAVTASMAMAGAHYDRALVALDHLPVGARVAAFTARPCTMEWTSNRTEHLSGMAVVRRRAFSNDQWNVAGAELLEVTKADAPSFIDDPSQLVVGADCKGADSRTLDASLAQLPRHAFDYVWLIDPPRYDPRLTAGLTAVWRDGDDALYRINSPRQ